MTDAAHVLFPNDAPKTSAPVAASSAAGSVSPQADVATLLFPSELKVANATPLAGPVDVTKPAEGAKPVAAQPSTEVVTIDRGSVERLDTLAEAVRLGGDADRAAALTETGNVLLAEAQASGTPYSDLEEIIGFVHEASATLSPMTADQLADGMAKGMRELADIPATDLDLARGLIRQMTEKMPSLPYQLEATGLGNRPDFIRAVIREAKRRGKS